MFFSRKFPNHKFLSNYDLKKAEEVHDKIFSRLKFLKSIRHLIKICLMSTEEDEDVERTSLKED